MSMLTSYLCLPDKPLLFLQDSVQHHLFHKVFFHFPLNVPAPISAFRMPSIDLDKQVSGHIAFMCKLVYGPGGLWLCLSHLCIPSI